jgi:hypothetical protein
MIKLGKTDPNYVRPRISFLLQDGVLEECGSKSDPVTGKTVRMVRIVDDPRAPRYIGQLEIESIAREVVA